jgi:hypothetical protein
MQSEPIRYEALVANIAAVEVQGSEVKVRWKCAQSGQAMGESRAWMAADTSMGSRVGANVKRGIAYEIIFGIARALSNVVGGAAGRVVSGAVNTAANEINTRVTAGVDYSEASRRDAIIAAFESVRGAFEWDEQRGGFVARKATPT